MRILGYIEHPELKITVFKMDERISVKCENAGYEQTYKLGRDDRFADLAAVSRLMDSQFLDEIAQHMRHMHRSRLAAIARTAPADEAELFETII